MIRFAVNGTLMRGLELNKHLLDVGATFICEAKTKDCYKLFSINDIHPAMYREDNGGGNKISLEIWELNGDGLASVLLNEPSGLCVGKVQLDDGTTVLGVLGEPHIFNNQKEITSFGGWKEYLGIM